MDSQQAATHKKRHISTGAVIALLILLYPVGIIVMWLATSWNRILKWVVTAPLVLAVALFGIGAAAAPKDTASSTAPTTAAAAVTSIPTQHPTAKPVKKLKVVVTNMIVKKVGTSTYRYFFDVYNQEQSDFRGDVFLNLRDGKGTPGGLIFGGATTSFADKPVRAGLHSVTYVDDSHPPERVAGIDGATTFVYSISINDNEVAAGKGDIATEYENLLAE